jgi:signal peptidase I
VQRIHGRRAAARRTRRRFFAELPFLLVAALILTVLVKGFLIQAFFIPSRSMEPTLDVGDRVVVNRLAYRLGDPGRGQVVVFLRPTGVDQPPATNEDLIKRVVGLPGDVLEGRDGYLLRNGRRVVEPYLRPNTFTSDFKKVRVKPDHFWVMGDNREDSADSRVFGQVHRSALVGRAILTVWPVPHAGGL